MPAYLGARAFQAAVSECPHPQLLAFALERAGGKVARHRVLLLPEEHPCAQDNFRYVERLVKMLIWQKGAFRLWVSGPTQIVAFLQAVYGSGGLRSFDAEFMAAVYQQSSFEVRSVRAEAELPAEQEEATFTGGHLDGCRIGFDAGGSDRKVAAVIDGKEVFSAETVWHPKEESDPRYHVEGVRHSLRLAAAHLPRVDAVGISSAGIYVDNRTAVASLFRKVSPRAFEESIRDLYLDATRDLFGDIPVEVRNDGDVSALAGAMSLRADRVLGLALGTSQAAGYVDGAGRITGHLNELAFAPVDFSPDAATDDEWSGDIGVGCQYFSQDAVIRLALRSGLPLHDAAPKGERLQQVQELLLQGDGRAQRVFESIGVFLGYGLLGYSQFYDLGHVLLLGRVMSGDGGSTILEKAKEVAEREAPEFLERTRLVLPDEGSRRVGQAIAAASLPPLARERV